MLTHERLGHDLDDLLETRESGYLALPFHEACRAQLAFRLLDRLIANKLLVLTRRKLLELQEMRAVRFEALPSETGEAINEWVAAAPIRTANQRMALARCFDHVKAVTRPLARARVGVGPSAASVADLMLELAQIQPGESLLCPDFAAGEMLAPHG